MRRTPGTPVVQAVYQYYNRAPFVIIGRKDRGVTGDFKSLQGKKVAAAAVESTRRAWPMVARKQGMKRDAFQWQTTDFSARDNVMVRGDVDAATYFHDSAVSLFARMKTDELVGAQVRGCRRQSVRQRDPREQQPDRAEPEGGGRLPARHQPRDRRDLRQPGARASRRCASANPSSTRRSSSSAGASPRSTWAPPTRAAHGLGDIRKLTLEQQVDEVAEVFGLKTRPSADAIFNSSMLPARSERTIKA